MKRTKRPWTPVEKRLFLSPLLFVGMAVGVGLWRQLRPLRIPIAKGSWVGPLSFSPDGKRLAVFVRDTNTYQTQIYDVETRTKVCDLASVPHTTPPSISYSDYFYWPSWSPDGTQLVAGYSDNTRGTAQIPNLGKLSKGAPRFHANYVGKIARWDTVSGRLTGSYLYAPLNEESHGAVSFSRDGQRLIGKGNPPSLFNAATGQRIRVFKGTLKASTEGQFNERLGMVALKNRDASRLQVVDTKTNRVLWEPQIGSATKFQWSSQVLGVINWEKVKGSSGDSRRTAKQLLLWDGKSRSLLQSPPLPKDDYLVEMSFNSKNNTIAVLTSDLRSLQQDANSLKRGAMPQNDQGEITIWDYRLRRVLWRYSTLGRSMWLQWSPDGKWLSVVTYPALYSDPHLLVFDNNGKLHLDREVADYTTPWSPDSTQVAAIFRGRNTSRYISTLRVG